LRCLKSEGKSVFQVFKKDFKLNFFEQTNFTVVSYNLDLAAEPPHIKLCRVPSPLPPLGAILDVREVKAV